ncbi:MAG: rhomboid family intramembrane serine protease [Calditrichaeota bacterium]|nr:rhomboid family intramembrane serine protease [Calditrichota bacterium]RQW08170.1 MAG: rhomboid family intramembrane serine protease [Calditrichota bacterium]
MYYQSGFGMMTPAVKNLLLANIAIFILQILAPGLNNFLIGYFGLVPALALEHFFIWQFVSYMFLHGGLGHIFFNMFALWMFGVELERNWGTREFLKFYFLTGIAAGLSTSLFSWGSMIPTIGASGAIYGILAAYALFFPDRYVYLYLLFPIKMKYLAIILGALEFISAYNQHQSGIAHVAHLGGMVVGYFYLRYKYRHWGIGKDFFKDLFKRK